MPPVFEQSSHPFDSSTLERHPCSSTPYPGELGARPDLRSIVTKARTSRRPISDSVAFARLEGALQRRTKVEESGLPALKPPHRSTGRAAPKPVHAGRQLPRVEAVVVVGPSFRKGCHEPTRKAEGDSIVQREGSLEVWGRHDPFVQINERAGRDQQPGVGTPAFGWLSQQRRQSFALNPHLQVVVPKRVPGGTAARRVVGAGGTKGDVAPLVLDDLRGNAGAPRHYREGCSSGNGEHGRESSHDGDLSRLGICDWVGHRACLSDDVERHENGDRRERSDRKAQSEAWEIAPWASNHRSPRPQVGIPHAERNPRARSPWVSWRTLGCRHEGSSTSLRPMTPRADARRSSARDVRRPAASRGHHPWPRSTRSDGGPIGAPRLG